MPSISWSKRAPFGRLTSASSDEFDTETGPHRTEPHADGTLGGVSDTNQARPRRGTKRGLIQSLLRRTQTKGKSATKPSRNTSVPEPETSAEERKRSPSRNGRGRAKTVAAGTLPSPPMSKPRSASTTAVSVPIYFRYQVMVAAAAVALPRIHTVNPPSRPPTCSFPIFPATPSAPCSTSGCLRGSHYNACPHLLLTRFLRVVPEGVASALC